MPVQKNQLEKNGLLKTKNFIFDHKGVQIPELNLKEKEKEKALLLQTIQFMGEKLGRIPAQNFNIPRSDVLYKKELNYLGTQLGRKFSAFFFLYSKKLIIPPPLLSTEPVCVSAYSSLLLMRVELKS